MDQIRIKGIRSIGGRRIKTFNKIIRAGLTETVTLKQRFDSDERFGFANI